MARNLTPRVGESGRDGSDYHFHDQEEVWHVLEGELEITIVDTNKMALLDLKGRDGVRVLPLFRDAREDVRLEQ